MPGPMDIEDLADLYITQHNTQTQTQQPVPSKEPISVQDRPHQVCLCMSNFYELLDHAFQSNLNSAKRSHFFEQVKLQFNLTMI